MVVASMIAAFEIAKCVDENGNDIEVRPEAFTETLLRYVWCRSPRVWTQLTDRTSIPKPFVCSVKPRSEKHEQAIRATLGLEYAYDW